MYSNDHLGSDDLDQALEMSRQDFNKTRPGSTSGSLAAVLSKEIKELDKEIDVYSAEEHELLARVKELRSLRVAAIASREAKAAELEMLISGRGSSNGRRSGIDYEHGQFEWTDAVLKTMKNVFGIDSFRLCQQGVINASMDGRDVVCVMPTGGGKSLTYQLPAVITPGCTLVISPLLSLISDQIMHLKEANISAVKLTGSTSKEAAREITQRLTGKSTSGHNEIKLCYVTPEKIAKSKTFLSTLSKMADANKLARIVIDEAHCVSQIGHDFRPDYQKLRVLRQLFPHVPISAVSATCPPKVLDDLVKTLGLPPVVSGNVADIRGTVYFSAPLYRKNLHYTVVTKQAQGDKVSEAMTEYILKHHPNDTGIIYCLSRKDADTVAKELQTKSGGKIKTGVYHSDIHDTDKEKLHVAWRCGTVKVVCATIAFGLGIDKSDVRFVLHHSISKSLDGFYQESGRAGRDGKDSDCVLYYRPQDSSALSAMMISEKDGTSKLHGMLRFAQDLRECRKLQFARYFSHSTQLSLSSWATDESDALDRCGHCDNCTRDPTSVEDRDVTFETWQILKIVEESVRVKNSLTFLMLTKIARGNRANSKGKEKEVDLEGVCGGKVELKQAELERLVVHLLLERYLADEYKSTAYSTNAYLKIGPIANRLIRLPKELVKGNSAVKVSLTFETRGKKKRTSLADGKKELAGTKRRKSTGSVLNSQPTKRQKPNNEAEDVPAKPVIVLSSDSDSEEVTVVQEEEGWVHTMRAEASTVEVIENDDDEDIVEIISDSD